MIVDVRTDEPDRRLAPGTTFETARGELTIDASRWHGRHLLVAFDGVRDRGAAEALRSLELRVTVSADERPDDPDDFYDHHLVGLRAEGQDGQALGDVIDVLHLPAQDVLVVRHDGRDVLVPFVVALVPLVDVAAGRLVIVDQPGLLSDETTVPPDAAGPVADQTGA